MADLFRFRCSECAKLLGVSPRKGGRLIHCPSCGTELIVPLPGDAGDASAGAADDASEMGELGIDLGFTSILNIRPAARADPVVAEPTFDVAEAIELSRKLVELEPGSPTTMTAGEDFDEESDPDAKSLIATKPEPLVPRSRLRRQGEVSFDRRRDVLLPRTAVIAWALFALVALALSFVAGLLIGHYRWKEVSTARNEWATPGTEGSPWKRPSTWLDWDHRAKRDFAPCLIGSSPDIHHAARPDQAIHAFRHDQAGGRSSGASEPAPGDRGG